MWNKQCQLILSILQMGNPGLVCLGWESSFMALMMEENTHLLPELGLLTPHCVVWVNTGLSVWHAESIQWTSAKWVKEKAPLRHASAENSGSSSQAAAPDPLRLPGFLSDIFWVKQTGPYDGSLRNGISSSASGVASRSHAGPGQFSVIKIEASSPDIPSISCTSCLSSFIAEGRRP